MPLQHDIASFTAQYLIHIDDMKVTGLIVHCGFLICLIRGDHESGCNDKNISFSLSNIVAAMSPNDGRGAIIYDSFDRPHMVNVYQAVESEAARVLLQQLVLKEAA